MTSKNLASRISRAQKQNEKDRPLILAVQKLREKQQQELRKIHEKHRLEMIKLMDQHES